MFCLYNIFRHCTGGFYTRPYLRYCHSRARRESILLFVKSLLFFPSREGRPESSRGGVCNNKNGFVFSLFDVFLYNSIPVIRIHDRYIPKSINNLQGRHSSRRNTQPHSGLRLLRLGAPQLVEDPEFLEGLWVGMIRQPVLYKE